MAAAKTPAVTPSPIGLLLINKGRNNFIVATVFATAGMLIVPAACRPTGIPTAAPVTAPAVKPILPALENKSCRVEVST